MAVAAALVLGAGLQGIDAEPLSDTAEATVVARLPQPILASAAVWDGTFGFVIGGASDGYLNTIVRFDPAENSAVTTSAHLPEALWAPSAVWDGSRAYVFGGQETSGDYSNEILRYDPSSESVDRMTATLPNAVDSMMAVWDARDRPLDGCPGGCAYLFGGRHARPSDQTFDTIVRYNPFTDAVTTMSARLPSAIHDGSAVWDGQYAYLFGGRDGCCGTSSERVVRYDPASDTVAQLATFGKRTGTSAIWDGQNAYVFGMDAGASGSEGAGDEIRRYDPVGDTVTLLSAHLPSARHRTSAIWDGQNAYVFGGGGLDEIVRFGEAPPPPPSAVGIDIKPGSDENPINAEATGVIPVAILSSEDFDARSEVDETTLTFGRTGDEASWERCGGDDDGDGILDVLEGVLGVSDDGDVNDDGLLDLICHFDNQAAGFREGDTRGTLRGATLAGVAIEGSDQVTIVPL